MTSKSKSRKSILSLVLSMLLAMLSGCVTTKRIDGIFLINAKVQGTMDINGSPVPIDTDVQGVYLISQDSLIEMLKQ